MTEKVKKEKVKIKPEVDYRHTEYKILEMKNGKVINERVSDRGHVMISIEEAEVMNTINQRTGGFYYVLDEENPTNEGVERPTINEIRKQVKNPAKKTAKK